MVHYVIEFSVHDIWSQENNIPCGEPDEAILVLNGEVDESEDRTFLKILIKEDYLLLGDMALGQGSLLWNI